MSKNTIKANKDTVIERNGRTWKVAALESYRNYQRDYIKKHYTGFTFRFKTDEDADVIKHLKNQKNAAEYVKTLVRKDMKKK